MTESHSILTPAEMADYAVVAATRKAQTPPLKSFLLALTGGAFIAVGFIFYLVSQQGADAMPMGLAKVVGGIVFSTGLALVVITGAELFTSSTLTLTARATGAITWAQLLRNWVAVYVGNFFGALTIVVLMVAAGTHETSKGALGLVALKTADAKTSHTFVQSLCLGILCNLMVCLAVWCSYAGRTVVDKIAAVTLPIGMFVAAGFEHCVANMFLLPYAMTIKVLAPEQFWATTGTTAEAFPHLTWTNMWLSNLVPVTIGNVVGGGVMIGIFYTLVHKRFSA